MTTRSIRAFRRRSASFSKGAHMRTGWWGAAATALLISLIYAVTTVGSHAQAPAQYVGSQSCRRCHAPTYERWSKTRMANVVRDPKEHPDAVLPDFSKPDPLLTFKLSDVAFVYGSRWKQRYFTKVGDDYFPLGAQWDVTHRVWRGY